MTDAGVWLPLLVMIAPPVTGSLVTSSPAEKTAWLFSVQAIGVPVPSATVFHWVAARSHGPSAKPSPALCAGISAVVVPI